MYFDFLHQNTETRRDLILNGRISTTMLFLSIPILMLGLVQSILPVVDGLFINNIVGTTAAGAIAYCGPIINMMCAIAQGLSVAGMAMIGQTNGKGDFEEARRISTQIVVFACVLGCIIAPLLAVVAFPVSRNVDARISRDVFVYLASSSFVLPFLFLESIYNAIKNASGKPEATFIRMILMLILKVIFNSLFIVVLRMGIIGAVAASLASNILICGWMFFELFVGTSDDKLKLEGFRFDYAILRELIRIGIPSMINTLMLSAGFFLINNEVEKYGPAVLAAQGIAGNITSVCFILPSSYGSSVTTMVSMNVGAGRGDKARSSCMVGCVISAITAAITIAIVVPLSPYITVLFTREKAVLDIANNALNIYTYSVVGFGIAMVQLGAYIGLGRTRMPLVMNFLRIWLIRYVFILLTEHVLGFYSVFWGNLVSNYLTAVITTILILRVRWVSVIQGGTVEGVKSKNTETDEKAEARPAEPALHR